MTDEVMKATFKIFLRSKMSEAKVPIGKWKLKALPLAPRRNAKSADARFWSALRQGSRRLAWTVVGGMDSVNELLMWETDGIAGDVANHKADGIVSDDELEDLGLLPPSTNGLNTDSIFTAIPVQFTLATPVTQPRERIKRERRCDGAGQGKCRKRPGH
ncbi:hypothetical protein C8R44DRAFT_726001 [Mycena epipterygia]|nr:hypothetical protein C8R44DRAFT_726001 [Mycena epipterygia]